MPLFIHYQHRLLRPCMARPMQGVNMARLDHRPAGTRYKKQTKKKKKKARRWLVHLYPPLHNSLFL